MPIPAVRRAAGDADLRFDAVTGVYHGERRGSSETYRFGFRRPGDWTHLDLDGRNGDLFLGRRPDTVGHLIVDGTVAVEHPQAGPGHRRLHAMVEQGFLVWSEPPQVVEPTTWEGRPAERLRWEVDGEWVDAVYDEATELCVSCSTRRELDELTDLRFDDDVDAAVFTPPPTRPSWRGGVAYVVEDERDPGRFLSSWESGSGPGVLRIDRGVAGSLADALAWSGERTDDIWIREVGGEHRRP